MHGVYNVIMEKSSNWSKKFSASAEWERLIKFFSYRSLAKQSAGLGHRLRDLRTTRPDLLKRFEVEATDELLNSLNKLQVQGQWKEWSKCMINDFTWNKVLREGNPAYISFQLKAVTNTLPSQDNLKRWNITNVDQNCVLCGKVNPTLRHVLTGCPVSLTQGRFTWRHDSVLKRIVIFLESALSILLIANGSPSPAPSVLLDEDELTGLSLSFSSISSISFQNPPPELMSTGSQTLLTDFAMVIRKKKSLNKLN